MNVGVWLQAVIYNVATILLYPVLAMEVICLTWAVFESGRFTLESLHRWRARRRLDLETAMSSMDRTSLEAIVGMLGGFGRNAIVNRARTSLISAGQLSRTAVLKALADAEIESSRRLEATRMLVRLGPILGLMGTLIPISPALVGLAKGDVETLSSNLVVAFSTTVVGLLIGAIAYVVTAIRERHHRQDVVDLEYIFDRLEL